jgi:hypothetical protein
VSWLVSETTEALARAQSDGTLPASVGIVVVVVTLVLLVEAEILRAAAPTDEPRPLRVVQFAVAPLLLACGAVIVVRLLDLL